MLLTDKYADKIHGIITCYDRMIIQGYIPNWSHAEAMTAYMKLNGIRIFDYPTSFSQPLTEQVRQNAEKIAHENGMEIEFIRKLHAFRKDDRIQNIIEYADFFTQENIDRFINLAIDTAQNGGKFEIQLLLMDYKAQKFGFEDIDDIEKRFAL